MKITLYKKLPAFFILVESFCVAHAQIVYTNLDPDVTLSYELDLNDDGIDDFSFGYIFNGLECPCEGPYGGPDGVIRYIDPLDSNYILNSGSSPKILLPNEAITGTSVIWSDAEQQELIHTNPGVCNEIYGGLELCNSPIIYGPWNSVSNKYIGLQLVIDSEKYFGWIRISVPGGIITKKAYAYNSISNQPILAGEIFCTLPSVTISADGPLTFCDGDNVILTAGGSGYIYQWKKNGVDIAGAISSTYTATNGGNYKCKVTNSCGSVISANKKVKIVCREADANLFADQAEINIYPNPTTDKLIIESPFTSSKIQIINLVGEIIYSEKNNSEQTEIDVSEFHCGMYMVVINNSGKKYFSNFIKQ